MAFYELQDRDGRYDCKPYVYLTESYRDDTGKVRKKRTYLGTRINNNKFTYDDDCVGCGNHSDILYFCLCANCLSKRSEMEIKGLKNAIF